MLWNKIQASHHRSETSLQPEMLETLRIVEGVVSVTDLLESPGGKTHPSTYFPTQCVVKPSINVCAKGTSHSRSKYGDPYLTLDSSVGLSPFLPDTWVRMVWQGHPQLHSSCQTRTPRVHTCWYMHPWVWPPLSSRACMPSGDFSCFPMPSEDLLVTCSKDKGTEKRGLMGCGVPPLVSTNLGRVTMPW